MKFLGLVVCVLACGFSAQGLDRDPSGGPGYYWRDFYGNVPNDALSASPNMYIGQVLTHGILQPAQVNKMEKMAEFVYNGQVYTQRRGFKVMCTTKPDQYEWIRTDNENIKFLLATRFMIPGGRDEGYPLLIGRSMETAMVGKISIYHRNPGLSYVSNDRPMLESEYEVIGGKQK